MAPRGQEPSSHEGVTTEVSCMHIALAIALSAGVVAATGGQPRLPRILIGAQKSTDYLSESTEWENSGGPAGKVSLETADAQVGSKAIHFRVNVDWNDPGQYPKGWPSFQFKPKPPLNFIGYDMIRFRVKADSSNPVGSPVFRFIVWTGDTGRINAPIPGLKWGEWKQAAYDLSGVPNLDNVTLLHFFIDEGDFHDGDKLHFVVDGFEVVKHERGMSALAADRCGVELYIGERERFVMVDQGAADIDARLLLHARAECAIGPEHKLVWRARELFSGKAATATQPIPATAPPGATTEWQVKAPLAKLTPWPGYYVITCDLVGPTGSVTDGWVGAEDLYVRKPGDPMTYSVLSMRLGVTYFIHDMLFGSLICGSPVAPLHTLDPTSRETYLEYMSLWAGWTGKHSEGLEAGLAGLAFAGEALRRYGDKQRADFADWLLRDSLDYIVGKMFLPDGTAIVEGNDLVDKYGEYIGAKGGPTNAEWRDTNQMGELLRPLARAVLYWWRLGMNKEYCEQLMRQARPVADFLVRESVGPLEGWNHVLYHYGFSGTGAKMEKHRYWQEGRQCDVYVGRGLSGLAYYAYAMAMMGQKVPREYVRVLRDTTEWAYAKMKPHEGWFDYQCGDSVEGGCHTFLGNMYIAEATFGWFAVADKLGLKQDAALAAEATKLGYHYVTDRCYIKGVKFDLPTEFWVGPYLYWELTEYLSSIGPDDTFTAWLEGLNRKWVTEAKWEDFLAREGGHAYRSEGNGALATAVLGYLGLKLMEEQGKPFHY
jgi:hypothetical protein